MKGWKDKWPQKIEKKHTNNITQLNCKLVKEEEDCGQLKINNF